MVRARKLDYYKKQPFILIISVTILIQFVKQLDKGSCMPVWTSTSAATLMLLLAYVDKSFELLLAYVDKSFGCSQLRMAFVLERELQQKDVT